MLANLGGATAFGQAAPPCTAIENDAERLACYDRALRAPAAVAPAAAAPAVAAPAPAAAAPAAAAPAAAVPASAAPAADAIGPIVVVEARVPTGREATFTAADGTRWVQTDSYRVVGLPDTPFDAEIKQGAMGSRFLLPKGHSRAIRVRVAR